MFFSLSWTVICSQNVCCLLFFVLTVFTHRYGRDGRDTKKYEDSCLLFDYEFLQNLSSPQSVQHYKSCLATFIDLLNENATTGNHNRKNHLSWATFSNTQFFTPDFSSFSVSALISSLNFQIEPISSNLSYLIIVSLGNEIIFNPTSQFFDFYKILCPNSSKFFV